MCKYDFSRQSSPVSLFKLIIRFFFKVFPPPLLYLKIICSGGGLYLVQQL